MQFLLDYAGNRAAGDAYIYKCIREKLQYINDLKLEEVNIVFNQASAESPIQTVENLYISCLQNVLPFYINLIFIIPIIFC